MVVFPGIFVPSSLDFPIPTKLRCYNLHFGLSPGLLSNPAVRVTFESNILYNLYV